MLTLLLYVLIVGLVAAMLFLVASAVFGRSEELGPLPEGTTATVLPADGVTGADVRALLNERPNVSDGASVAKAILQ